MSYPTYSDLELEIQNLEEENKKLRSEIENMKEVGRENMKEVGRENMKEVGRENMKEVGRENMKEVGRENIETLDRMSIELENYSKSFKRYRDFSKQELADSLYDAEEQNKSLKNELMEDMKTETKLNEEIRNLKSELSKFSEAYKKYRDYEKEELAESCYDLARENEKLEEEVRGLVERNIELNKKYIFVLSQLRR